MRRPRFIKLVKWGCGCTVLAFAALLAMATAMLSRVPSAYPPVANPIPPPASNSLSGGIDGFNSPYLGHTGSWDGKGGALGGFPKTKDLDREAGMGLRWTFMPVYWRVLEPQGAVDLSKETPPAWRSLDRFILAAYERRLNVLMQIVIGGNAGGPPGWAGRREPGKSAPENMEAAAALGAKLAARYAPEGTLAVREGWGGTYGVRAWEMDNEPNGYRTCWEGQAADYAEFVTKTAAAIRRVDRQAVIVGPAANIGPKSLRWIESALDAPAMRGSPEFRRRGKQYSIGPPLDVVSFHIYEGLDTAFMGKDRTIGIVFSEIRQVFERWENRVPGFEYRPKQDYWQTEGNFDFFGILSRNRRAAWRIQFMTRAFAAGVRKVMVMDASPPEQDAVRAYIRALPDPFPMLRATGKVKVLHGRVVAFCHPDDASPRGRAWVLWATPGTGDAEVEVPCIGEQVKTVAVDGTETPVPTTNGHLRVQLRGDGEMAPPVLVVDRPARAGILEH